MVQALKDSGEIVTLSYQTKRVGRKEMANNKDEEQNRGSK